MTKEKMIGLTIPKPLYVRRSTAIELGKALDKGDFEKFIRLLQDEGKHLGTHFAIRTLDNGDIEIYEPIPE